MSNYVNKRHEHLMVQGHLSTVEGFLLLNGMGSQEERLYLALLLLGYYMRHHHICKSSIPYRPHQKRHMFKDENILVTNRQNLQP